MRLDVLMFSINEESAELDIDHRICCREILALFHEVYICKPTRYLQLFLDVKNEVKSQCIHISKIYVNQERDNKCENIQ